MKRRTFLKAGPAKRLAISLFPFSPKKSKGIAPTQVLSGFPPREITIAELNGKMNRGQERDMTISSFLAH